MYYGPGAGQKPTATVMSLADIVHQPSFEWKGRSAKPLMNIAVS